MSNRMAIATTINSGWVTALRLHPNKEKATKAISERIEQEKNWCAGCIELGFKKHKVKPVPGHEIEYNVIDMEDGGIRIEAWQDVEGGNNA